MMDNPTVSRISHGTQGALTFRVTGEHGAVTFDAISGKMRLDRTDGLYGGEGNYLRREACQKAARDGNEAAIYTALEDEYMESMLPRPDGDEVTPEDFELGSDRDGEQSLTCPACGWEESVAGPSLRLALRIATRHIEDKHRPAATAVTA